jgi:hypothetical protein
MFTYIFALFEYIHKAMESEADTELYRGYEWGSSVSPGICQILLVFPSVTLAQCIYNINAYPLVYMRTFITVITPLDVRLFKVVSVPLEDIDCGESECS